MKAARKMGALVVMLFVLVGTVLAQEHLGGNLAELQKAPTVLALCAGASSTSGCFGITTIVIPAT